MRQLTPPEQGTQHQLVKSPGSPIVVNIDASPACDAAIKWASHEADLKHTGLLLVQVRPNLFGDVGRRVSWHPMPARLTTRVAERFGVPVDGIASQSPLIETLAAAANGAQLLVVGKPELTSTEPLARRCAPVVSCPVVTVPLSYEPKQSIVIGLDDSPESWAALNWGVAEARARRCACELVHVTDQWAASSNRLHARRAALALIERAAEYAAYCEVEARANLVTGLPASALLEASADAELVVLGGRLHSKTDRLVHRDVAGLVLRASVCPVVIVTTHHLGQAGEDEGQEHRKGGRGPGNPRSWPENWPIEVSR